MEITQGLDIIEFNTAEAHTLSVKPGVHLRNPFVPGVDGGLMKIIDQRHKYKMLHLNVPEDVLIPQTNCATWSPSKKMYVTNDTIECAYYEVNDEMCPDQFLASCLHNISSKGADIQGVMLQSQQPISAITGAIVVGLNTAIASSAHKVAMFSDPNIGTSDYHSNAKADYLGQRSTDQRDRMLSMLQRAEGIDTLLRRRAGEGRVAFVNTNDGSGADANATLPANIKGFLKDMLLQSSDALRYWKTYSDGSTPVFKLQSGLYQAYIDYLDSLPGGSDNHMFIVNGTPVEGVYRYKGYPVMEWHEADVFDFSIGLKNPATGHSWNQRAILTVPDNMTLLTNVGQNEVGTGLTIQTSPLIKDKGVTWMYMSLGVAGGISHNELVTYGYNTSYTYATS